MQVEQVRQVRERQGTWQGVESCTERYRCEGLKTNGAEQEKVMGWMVRC